PLDGYGIRNVAFNRLAERSRHAETFHFLDALLELLPPPSNENHPRLGRGERNSDAASVSRARTGDPEGFSGKPIPAIGAEAVKMAAPPLRLCTLQDARSRYARLAHCGGNRRSDVNKRSGNAGLAQTEPQVSHRSLK